MLPVSRTDSESGVSIEPALGQTRRRAESAMHYTSFCIRVEQEGPVLLVLLEGDLRWLDLTDAQLTGDLFEKIRRESAPLLVIDCNELVYCDSTLLSVLVNVWKQVRNKQGKMMLACVPDGLATLLRYTKLTTLWDTFDSRQSALDAINAWSGKHTP